MEKAIHISHPQGLKYFDGGKYQRLYWGAEFCQNLIPDEKDTAKAVAFALKNHAAFSLMTPFVTDQGLGKLDRLFSYFKKNKITCEVIVNDWGVLEHLRSGFDQCFEPVLGRLLVRQQRDPSLTTVLEQQPPYAVKDKKTGKLSLIIHRPPGELYRRGMMASYISSRPLQDFLSGFGIERIELNHVIQGLYLRGIKFKKSIYTPFVHVSTTRFCPMESKVQKIYRIGGCRKECQRHFFKLRSKNIPLTLFKRGNTLFYKNPWGIQASGGSDCGIDRVVYQPELPF